MRSGNGPWIQHERWRLKKKKEKLPHRPTILYSNNYTSILRPWTPCMQESDGLSGRSPSNSKSIWNITMVSTFVSVWWSPVICLDIEQLDLSRVAVLCSPCCYLPFWIINVPMDYYKIALWRVIFFCHWCCLLLSHAILEQSTIPHSITLRATLR